MGIQNGFTLIELMGVVAIIGVLAAIAIPNMGDALRRSRESATKGNLGTLRSALAIYYADTEGQYPYDNLASLTAAGKYLPLIPKSDTVIYHHAGNVVGVGTVIDDVGTADVDQWWYDNVYTDYRYGQVWVNCNHTDLKGSVWLSY